MLKILKRYKSFKKLQNLQQFLNKKMVIKKKTKINLYLSCQNVLSFAFQKNKVESLRNQTGT